MLFCKINYLDVQRVQNLLLDKGEANPQTGKVQSWILKNFFASLPRQNRLWSTQNWRQILIWKIFVVRKSTHIYQMSISTERGFT